MTSISDMVTDAELLDCGLYCDQLTTVKMLETKAKVEEKAGNFENMVKLHLMTNNIEALLMSAAEKKKLTDFLLSAAATVSRKFYNEMCKKYAVQLIEERQYVKAGFYLMFCGELHNAVRTLLDKTKILEALALAKAQLPADDPFIHGILTKTANHFAMNHEYEREAECHLAKNEPSQAAKVLYRNGDSSSLYACVYICKKFNLIEEAESYGYLCMEKCSAECAWPIFYKVVDIIDSLKVYKLLGRVHELIFTQMKILKKEEIPSGQLFGITGNKLKIWESKTFGELKVPFLPFIYDQLKSENILPEDKDSLAEIGNALDSLITKRQKYETSAEAHINLAMYASQVIVSSLLNNSNVVEKYFLKIFPTVYDIAFLPRVVFWLFLPFDIHWCSNKDVFVCENKYLESQPPFLHLQSIYKSLCDKFASLNSSAVEKFSISQNFSSCLDETVNEALSILSTKTLKDSVVLYFSMCYIAEMKKLAKHGWKFRCYNRSTKVIEKVEPEDCDSLAESGERNGDKDTVCLDHKNIKESEVEVDVNCNDSAGLNNIPAALPPAKDIDNEIHLSSQIKDTECTPQFIENKNVTAPNSLMPVDDIIEKMDSTTTSNMLTELENSIDPVCNNADAETVNGSFENVNNEIENDFLLTKKIENGILTPKVNIGDIEVNALLHDDNKIGENALLQNSNGEIDENALLHNSNGEIGGNILLQSSNDEIGETALLHNNDEDEESMPLPKNSDEIGDNALSQNNNDEVEEKDAAFENTVIAVVHREKIPSLEYTHNSNQVEGTYSEAEEDHLQCWCDISFFYTLTKSFTSVNCRDEYALLYYLQKYLHYVDNNIADLARQKSVKSALNNDHKELLEIKKDSSQLNQDNICRDLNDMKIDHQDSTTLENVEASYSPVENGSSCSKDDDGFMKKETENEADEKLVNGDDTNIELANPVIGDNTNSISNEKHTVSENLQENKADENLINSDETNVKLANPIIKDSTNSVPNGKHTISENLQLEHEKVSKLMELFNSVEFDYPNPFDAVSLINEVCCDVVRKNPCNFVKKKFHDFAHEVNKWNAKFCVKDETVICDICKEIIYV